MKKQTISKTYSKPSINKIKIKSKKRILNNNNNIDNKNQIILPLTNISNKNKSNEKTNNFKNIFKTYNKQNNNNDINNNNNNDKNHIIKMEDTNDASFINELEDILNDVDNNNNNNKESSEIDEKEKEKLNEGFELEKEEEDKYYNINNIKETNKNKFIFERPQTSYGGLIERKNKLMDRLRGKSSKYPKKNFFN